MVKLINAFAFLHRPHVVIPVCPVCDLPHTHGAAPPTEAREGSFGYASPHCLLTVKHAYEEEHGESYHFNLVEMPAPKDAEIIRLCLSHKKLPPSLRAKLRFRKLK